jgi:Tfp pilus assembly protein PilF
MSSKEDDEPLASALELLAELLDFKTYFYSSNETEKSRRVEAAVERILGLLSGHLDGPGEFARSPSSRAARAYVRGRALDCRAEFSPEAEVELGVAVKLAPNKAAHWNAMGHCLWKKGEQQSARHCFERALASNCSASPAESATALREISKLMRQLPVRSMAEKAGNLRASLERAEAAVEQDSSDAESWCVVEDLVTSFPLFSSN